MLKHAKRNLITQNHRISLVARLWYHCWVSGHPKHVHRSGSDLNNPEPAQGSTTIIRSLRKWVFGFYLESVQNRFYRTVLCPGLVAPKPLLFWINFKHESCSSFNSLQLSYFSRSPIRSERPPDVAKHFGRLNWNFLDSFFIWSLNHHETSKNTKKRLWSCDGWLDLAMPTYPSRNQSLHVVLGARGSKNTNGGIGGDGQTTNGGGGGSVMEVFGERVSLKNLKLCVENVCINYIYWCTITLINQYIK